MEKVFNKVGFKTLCKHEAKVHCAKTPCGRNKHIGCCLSCKDFIDCFNAEEQYCASNFEITIYKERGNNE